MLWNELLPQFAHAWLQGGGERVKNPLYLRYIIYELPIRLSVVIANFKPSWGTEQASLFWAFKIFDLINWLTVYQLTRKEVQCIKEPLKILKTKVKLILYMSGNNMMAAMLDNEQ